MKPIKLTISLFCLIAFVNFGQAQEPTKEMCDAIIRDGTPKAAVDYCLGKYPSGTGGSSTGGSSTENKSTFLMKTESGEILAVRKVDEAAEISDKIDTSDLETIKLSEKQKVDVQMNNGRFEPMAGPSD